MTRFYLRLMTYALIAAAVAVLMVCAQSHTRRDLQWLPEDNCSSSCFLGIHPGETTVAQAEELLKAHPWVSQVLPMNTTNSLRLGWLWSDQAPDILRHAALNADYPIPVDGEIIFENGVAHNIGFNTNLTFGDIALALKYPEESQLVLPGLIITSDSSVLAAVSIMYQGFLVSGTLKCPYAMHVWRAPIHISIYVDFATSPVQLISVQGKNFLSSIRHTSQLMCSRQF